MPLIPYQPQNLTAEQDNANILLTWNGSLGATYYQVQRSLDGINFSNLGISNSSQYLDQYPGIGIQYFYRVAGVATLGAYAVANLTFTGQPNIGDTVTIANVVFTANTDFVIGGTVSTTITNLVNAINASNPLKFTVSASAAGNVITISSLVQGPIGNGLEFNDALTDVTGSGFMSGVGPNQGPYSSVVSMVAAPPSEMSLGELRLRSQQKADRVGSQFVTNPEWNYFIRLAMYELYDILMTSFEDYFAQDFVAIQTDGSTFRYPLPDGATNYLGGNYNGQTGTPAPAFYKLAGMDLNVNTSALTPSRVSLLRFDFIKRNQYVYPNSTSTIYGVYNMRYRIMGNFLNIIPTPAGNQTLIAWYSGRLPQLLLDTDLTTIGTSGWLAYVIARSAKYALDKEEDTDTTKLDNEIIFLNKRIEQAASNRDAGEADTISETRTDPIYGGTGFAGGSSNGGW